MDHLKLTVDKLSVDVISDLVFDNSCGAVSIFVGTTRDNFEDKKVVQLEYEAYEPMALKAMKSICDEVREKWPVIHGIAIFHRLGVVPCREASVVVAVSSPHRRDSLDAVSHCIERLKASVPIWKKEVYEDHAATWKENVECPHDCDTSPHLSPPSQSTQKEIDKNLIQINVSNEEIQRRIQNFIERKREQVNLNNIHDFIPNEGASETEDPDTCARVRTQFVRRTDSKSHLKIHKVHNEWGPQTMAHLPAPVPAQTAAPAPAPCLPAAVAERVLAAEDYLSIRAVSPDVYQRLKQIEDRIAYLQAVSPEYAHFWKSNNASGAVKQEHSMDFLFSANDIAHKIELLEKEVNN